ncbi:MAG: DUF3048 domain-containing protein [Coriobacteriia bacterium]|nr:DUF3048 domain-containing protein [Coriobacteriia bacterium]
MATLSKKSMLWAALLCILLIACAALSGCRAKEPLVVTPPVVVEEPEPEPEPVEPIRWPLTGLEAPDETVILARPLSVKIENSPQSRPQAGLNSADVVYETLTEGGITRFNAIYQSEIPERVVPVRSARLSDAWIVPQFGNGLFFYSGCNNQVASALRDAHVANMSHDVMGNNLYGRDRNRFSPHNLYLELAEAYAAAESKGFDIATAEPITGFSFQSLVFENPSFASVETTATDVNIPFSDGYRMNWQWNAAISRWERFTNGQTQKDALTDTQINTTNLIVLWATHTQGGVRDASGNSTYRIDLGGEGKATIFMNGKRIDGTWTASADAVPVFKDPRGEVILLAPGRSWVSVLPLDIAISSSYESDEGAANGANH